MIKFSAVNVTAIASSTNIASLIRYANRVEAYGSGIGLGLVEGEEPAAGQSNGNHTYRSYFINTKIILSDNKNNTLSQICVFNGTKEHSIQKVILSGQGEYHEVTHE